MRREKEVKMSGTVSLSPAAAAAAGRKLSEPGLMAQVYMPGAHGSGLHAWGSWLRFTCLGLGGFTPKTWDYHT